MRSVTVYSGILIDSSIFTIPNVAVYLVIDWPYHQMYRGRMCGITRAEYDVISRKRVYKQMTYDISVEKLKKDKDKVDEWREQSTGQYDCESDHPDASTGTLIGDRNMPTGVLALGLARDKTLDKLKLRT